MTNTLLSVRDLSYQHIIEKSLLKPSKTFQIEPMSFDLNRGEIISIIGSSNSGKSTIGHLIVGSLKPQGGSILLEGKDINSLTLKQKCTEIRMVFQHATEALNPSLTLKAILDHALTLNTSMSEKERESKIYDTILKVGLLPEHAYFYRNMMSDGQRQRAAFARALILDPKVIVADEPFAALDPSVRSRTVNFILDLCRENGLAFVVISNNLGIVRHMSDRLIVLHQGNVIESGKTDTIFNWPKHPYTKRLLQTYSDLTNTD